MAILGGDSFDHYRNASLTAYGTLQKWDSVVGAAVLATGEGRFGTTALRVQVDTNGYLVRNYRNGDLQEVGHLFAVRSEATSAPDIPILRLMDNLTQQI